MTVQSRVPSGTPFSERLFKENAVLFAAEKAEEKKKDDKTKEQTKERNFALNFRDVEISEFLNIMSQLIGKNIILDDKIKGKISISSARKVPVSQAYNIMKSILEVKGLAVVETDNLIKVLPIQDAIKKNVEIIVDGKRTEIPPSKTRP
jgi:type II secretory pathway component GspD/PulD (secretin)